MKHIVKMIPALGMACVIPVLTAAEPAAAPIMPAEPAAAPAPAEGLSRCTAIASALQRLECFDTLAGTPLKTIRENLPKPRRNVAEVISATAALEKGRPGNDSRFRMLESDERGGQRRVLISAPALNRPAPQPLLTISCMSNITRLQFIVYPPVARNQVRVGLNLDGRPVVPAQTWQVLEDGSLVDAGRGLAGIDVVRRLGSGAHLEVASDLPALDGLRFNAEGLGQLIGVQRKACGW